MKVKNTTNIPITVVISKEKQEMIFPGQEKELEKSKHMDVLVKMGFLQLIETKEVKKLPSKS